MNLVTFKVRDLLLPRSLPKPVAKSEYKKSGTYPIIDQAEGHIGGYSNRFEHVNFQIPAIIFGDHTRRVKWVSTPFCRGAEGVQVLYCNEEIIHPRFFYYLLQTIDLSSFGYARHYKYLKSETVTFAADKDQQIRVANVLSTYDRLIENNQRRIRLLEESVHLLYREWFVYLRCPNHPTTVKGWKRSPLIELAEVTMGQSPKSGTFNTNGIGLPFHQGVKGYGFRFVQHTTYSTMPLRLANKGDILFSVRAPVGRINVAPEQIAIGRGLSAIRSRTGYSSFLFYQLKNHFHTENMIGQGSIFASVTTKDLKQTQLIHPPTDLMKRFEDIASVVDQQIWILQKQTIRLLQTRDTLIPTLMRSTARIL